MEHAPHPTLILTPGRQAVPANGGTLEVLLRLQAPDRPASDQAAARGPLRLAVVIDRSGSMSGEPLHEALKCAEYIAAGLQPVDELAVVLYDNQVHVPFPLQRGGDVAALRRALEGVESGGNTALFDGWEAGATILGQGTERSMSRVLLLSDGQANEGLCEPVAIEKHCAQWAARGVSTTTVGLGRNFNEDLMTGMARAGGGQHYYGQTAKDLQDSFDEELALLQSLFLRQVRVRLAPAAGVIVEPLGIVQQLADGRYALKDLAWASEAWMLVRLHVAANPGADPRQPQALLAVAVEGELEGGKPVVGLRAMLSLPVVSDKDCEGLPLDELVARRLKEVEFGQSTATLRDLVMEGNITAAEKLLTELERQVADHPWLAEKVAALKQLVARDAPMAVKEMHYAMLRTSQRLASKSEGQYRVSETDNSEMPKFLRRKSSEGQGQGQGRKGKK
ncbi:vWA domain-containing protein [Caenimonas soli]|uniref:vWA domain-containing protein n=1 Tax=Caenimonas soli TaxID=2735555 RepID=UPI0015572375|nr:VWA domain-containing protein [Caenimonas soli]NPC56674.1 VWA domain-containing protein [Caenimonas soli]